MVVNTIYIARHGYRSNWLPNGPYPPPPTGVDSDVPLASHGENQAQELAHYIHSLPEEEQPQLLISSPFYRCIQTIYPLAQLLDKTIQLDTGVGEYYKEKRYCIPQPAKPELLRKLFLHGEKYIEKDMWCEVIPNKLGETDDSIMQRCLKFWPQFINKVERGFPAVERIMIVTHAATKIALGMALLGFDNVLQPLDNKGTIIRSGACSIDKYICTEEQNITNGNKLNVLNRHWVMIMNGNTEFLTKGEEMHWDFRTKAEAGSDEEMKLKKQQQNMSGFNKGSDSINIDENKGADDEYITEDVFVTIQLPVTSKNPTKITKKDNGNTKSSNSTSLDKDNNNPNGIEDDDDPTIFQYSGLDSESPLIKIGDKIYRGEWNKLVGTELVITRNESEKEGEDTQKKSKEANNDLEEHNIKIVKDVLKLTEYNTPM
ncbi:related to Transcription factor tau 55 kDa subunit [Saccharomycodes ludwigii]|uniref:Related to Transcription factor tau 55 kDa subunit n=1 Tax=Saccharomycodes ludwigii TaxID=36035 RepID=A0A376B3A1_9ASCO|nr:hypothetical protein SCDLUD_002903 [Saccharomycodes ludwigii]KAH3901411.1 hypothetical protein SCDLUD_002903 [Saccharomycodes ludwigii]SSD59131.1 related to Transcription factor tau 55 kDa subunit [Saccharomycodes ludwigii]